MDCSVESAHRELCDRIPNAVFYQLVRGPDGVSRFNLLSAGVERLFGVARVDLIADPAGLLTLIHSDDHARLREAERIALESNGVIDLSVRGHTANGLRSIHLRAVPALRADGSLVLDGMLFDIGGLAEPSIVTMCAWTRRVKMDGRWVPVEEYLRVKFGVQVSHGISEETLKHLQQEAESGRDRDAVA
jgi:PAS domain-containing protein